MNTSSVCTPLKDYLANIRKGISVRVPLKDYLSRAVGLERKGAEALAEQNKLFVRPPNQVDPERVDFGSTKEMLEYAKTKAITALKDENPHEYTVVANVKTNKVWVEYTGDHNNCTLKNLESFPLDENEVVLVHGHPDSYPISRADVKTLLEYRLNQVIAVDKDGNFSMVARKPGVTSAKIDSKEMKAFTRECDDNYDTYLDIHSENFLKRMTHSTLVRNADALGLRYITNYPYLIEANKSVFRP